MLFITSADIPDTALSSLLNNSETNGIAGVSQNIDPFSARYILTKETIVSTFRNG